MVVKVKDEVIWSASDRVGRVGAPGPRFDLDHYAALACYILLDWNSHFYCIYWRLRRNIIEEVPRCRFNRHSLYYTSASQASQHISLPSPPSRGFGSQVI